MTCLFQNYPEVFVDEVFFHISIKKKHTHTHRHTKTHTTAAVILLTINEEMYDQVSQEEDSTSNISTIPVLHCYIYFLF